MTAPILAITSGEPAGIGPDICLDLAFADLPCRPVVLCDKNLLAQRAEQLGKSVILRNFQAQAADPLPKGELEVMHIPLDAECRAANSILPMPRMCSDCWIRRIKAFQTACLPVW